MSEPEQSGDNQETAPTSREVRTLTGKERTDIQANTEWRTDRPKDGDKLGSLWIRWTDGGSDLQLHQICEIVPQVRRDGQSIKVVPEKGDRPTFEPVSAKNSPATETDRERVQFRLVSGLPRQLLRHVPLLILVSTLVLFLGAELIPEINGVSTLVPQVTGPNAMLFGIFLLIIPPLLWLLATVEVIPSGEFPVAVGIYGLISVLAAGTAASVLLVLSADHSRAVEPNVVLVSGYILSLLVGGMLLYDAILRVEHLLTKLHKRDGDIIKNNRAYRRYLTDLHEKLNHPTVAGVHPSRLFGFLFALQFLIIWVVGNGPQSMNYSLGLGVNFVLNIVLVTIVFQFFIFVTHLNRLISEKEMYSNVGLQYEPFHVDEYGGFRDFGRLAIRVNAILTAAGIYLVYRLYIIGGREFPVEGFSGFTNPVVMTVWLISFVGPILAYALGVGAWGYYSFWSLHRKMERDKKELTRKYQGKRGPDEANRVPSAGDTIESFNKAEGPEWGALYAAPTWPLDVNKMVSLLSGNIAPLAIPIVNLFL